MRVRIFMLLSTIYHAAKFGGLRLLGWVGRNMRWHFEGGGISRCGKISWTYGMLLNYTVIAESVGSLIQPVASVIRNNNYFTKSLASPSISLKVSFTNTCVASFSVSTDSPWGVVTGVQSTEEALINI